MLAVCHSTLARIALLAVVAVFFSGCAAQSSNVRHGTKVKKDRDYVAAVERAARARGVQVVWVNPPPELGKNYLRSAQRDRD